MYNRVGRALFVVGRQFRRNFCENASIGAIGCAASTAIFHCRPNNYAFSRSYCQNYSDESDGSDGSDGSDDDIPKIIPKEEEGEARMKEFLSNPENERKLKIIQMEMEVLRQMGHKIPDVLKTHHWAEIVQLGSRSKRKRYAAYLFGVEKKKEKGKRMKVEKREAHEALVASGLQEKPLYSLGSYSLFLRLYDQTINRVLHGRLMNQMLYGQKIVFDCGYEEYMTSQERKNCAKQLQLVFATNRVHKDPFDLYLCNANPHSEMMKTLYRSMPTMFDDDFPLTVKPESYLDIFDKKNLVYLTPHCNNEMQNFDHDAIYIVGAFVDKSSQQPLSMAKAKKEGLKMAKFPLNRYLEWGTTSSKNLTLNHVVDILLDLRLHGSWEAALKNIPRRKLQASRVAALERKVQKSFAKSSVMNDADDTPAPVREIRPKVGSRFNSDTDYRPNRDPQYRSGYERNYKSDSRRGLRTDSDGSYGGSTKKDFSMKSRAKFKNNWKN